MLSYESSEFKALAFTIKKLKDPKNATVKDYIEVLCKWLKLDVDIQAGEYERDSTNVLHIHGIIVVKKNFYKRRLQVEGYHVYIRDIYDKTSWLRYINKTKLINKL